MAAAKEARRPSRPGPPQLPLPVSGRPTLEAEWAPLPESSDRCVEPESPPPPRPSESPGSSSSESQAEPPSASGCSSGVSLAVGFLTVSPFQSRAPEHWEHSGPSTLLLDTLCGLSPRTRRQPLEGFSDPQEPLGSWG